MRRLVELLLSLHPRDFREARRDEVLAFVDEGRRRAAERGRPALTAFWVRTLLDLAGSGVRMRRGARRGRGRSQGNGEREGTMRSLAQDLRYAARALAGGPLVTAVVVLTLGLAVGLGTGIFSVVDAVLLEPLEYREPEALVEVEPLLARRETVTRANFSAGDVRAVREGVEGFEAVAGVGDIRQNLTGGGLPRQVRVGWTSHRLFPLLGVEAALGRTFAEDDPPGTAVLSHELWRDRFGSDPEVLGRTVGLDGHTYTIVGVLPRGFRLHLPRFPRVQIWKNPDAFWQNGDVWSSDGPSFGFFQVVARYAPGAEPRRVQAELDAVAAGLRARWEEYEREGMELAATGLHERVVGDVRPSLLLLSGAVALVLLVACANVANLLLVRAQRRRRELAVRLALGSSRLRVARLLFAESLLLALAGGGLGVFLGAASVRLLRWAGPALPRAEGVAVDLDVLGFALLVSLGCTVLVGLAPALGAARNGVADVLGGSRGSLGGGRRLRGGLVVAQISLSLVLFIGAGLLTSSLVELQSVEPGFEAEGVLTVSVTLPGARYEWPQGVSRFFGELEDRLGAVPGVRAVGTIWPLPLDATWRSRYEAGALVGEDDAFGDYRVGTEGYFETLGVPVVEGRLFEPSDPREVVVVSESIARRAWPEDRAVGKTLRANPWGGGPVEFRVIGVVGDVHQRSLREAPAGELYFDIREWAWADWEFNVVARTDGPPEALIPRVRELVAEMDPEVPVADPVTMEGLVSRKLGPNRFALGLVGLFSLVAGVLALVGLYGVVSYSVGMRTREIGLRMALGSAAGRVARRILGEGMRLAALGVALGILGSLALTRLLSAYLFGVEPTDPGTFVLVSVLVGGLAALASWIPARRAAGLDPATVLRAE